MDLEELKKTDLYQLYEKGLNYMRMKNVFRDTDLNYRMYNGNQWEGAKIDGIEQAQYNFIETIVNFKVTSIHQNLWAIHYSSDNFETIEFRETADKVCKMLDRRASKVWENDKITKKLRDVSYDSAINDEGVIYVNYNEEKQDPENEIIDKNNIQYGNEQCSDIQKQPYIIISQRKPIIELRRLAKELGVPEEDIGLIMGDTDTLEQSGEDAKLEKDEMCTLVTKMYKDNGEVWYERGTKYVTFGKPMNSGLKLYPVAHILWKNKKGNARGEGEVRTLIPNQLELNKTLARMLLSIKQCAYAIKVANTDKIANPQALNQIGGIIKTKNGANVEDVSKIFTYIQPASMSTDVSKLISDLISITRDLRNTSEIATGSINPEDASGKAILAVQQASKQPLNDQQDALNNLIEDLARIWLDMWVTYSQEGMKLEEEIENLDTNEKVVRLVKIPSVVLENLQGNVRIDVTPETPYDKYAREMSLENLLKAGYFAPQMVSQLRIYAEALPDNAVMPKRDILKICDKIEREQRKIAQIEAQAQLMQQRANTFLGGDPESQMQQIADAQAQLKQEPEEIPEEEVG